MPKFGLFCAWFLIAVWPGMYQICSASTLSKPVVAALLNWYTGVLQVSYGWRLGERWLGPGTDRC